MNTRIAAAALLLVALVSARAAEQLTDYVNPFLGTAPLTELADVGYTPKWRVWAGLTFPGTSVPNAMVQLSPITKFGSGAGYEYEDTVLHGFAHSNKGHWNLCHIPILPVSGEVDPEDFGSSFSHQHESAHPGYYQVLLERYGINVELTSTLRCGFHRYGFKNGDQAKRLVVNLPRSNERVRGWDIELDGDHAFKGNQRAGETAYFYAAVNRKIDRLERLKNKEGELPVLTFGESSVTNAIELRIGLSYVSVENAKENMEKELGGKTFDEVRAAANSEWQTLLSKIQVSGGTGRQKQLFYSCLYRSFLWPALRSDVNGEFLDASHNVVKGSFRYYTVPSLWDDYRNKLVLLGMLAPDTTADVIQSLVDRGEKTGFLPTFFHGDHAAPFIAGSYLRGLRGYDITNAYRLMLKSATTDGGSRPHIKEYMERGYISTPDIPNPRVETKAKAGVTKTLEYAYDDYSVALLAKAFNDETNHAMLMKRTKNYTNLFDASTGLMRGRLENGDWVKNFDPTFPYYEYMYREANAWQSSFFAPHDTRGLIGLYGSDAAFEKQLDSLFTIPWDPKHIARNISCFIGQYCQGNQPDHSFPYLYTFIGKQEKSQAVLDTIMSRFYGMGKDGLALSGMDDAGEMSSWYVFAAAGFYPYSPADPEYIVSVPLFDTVKVRLGANTVFTLQKAGSGRMITNLSYDGRKLDGYFVQHSDLARGKTLVITTE
jgi:predicted alpha-1,2-mannosidase